MPNQFHWHLAKPAAENFVRAVLLLRELHIHNSYFQNQFLNVKPKKHHHRSTPQLDFRPQHEKTFLMYCTDEYLSSNNGKQTWYNRLANHKHPTPAIAHLADVNS